MGVIQETEQDVLYRLETKLIPQGIDVQPLPEDDANFKRMFEKPIVSLVWIGDDYEAPRSVSGTLLDKNITFQVFIQSRTLRDDLGIYDVCDKVKDALRGFTPIHCSRQILFKKIKFMERTNGGFMYYLEVSALGADGMMSDEDDGYPMNSITINLQP